MTKSEIVFGKFIQSLTNETLVGDNKISFRAKVIYKYQNKLLEETLEVFCDKGFDYGKIDISEGKKITSQAIHLNFVPTFQEYSFTNENFLLVKGSSQKIGNYEVLLIVV